MTAESHANVDLSVVAPAHNEEGNVAELARQIEGALRPLGINFEFVLVDDGSTDRTGAIAMELARERPWMRVVRMLETPAGRGNGQSAAFCAGFRASRGRLIAVLDADLQNDPGDIPAMLALMDRQGADLVQGDRSHARADNWARRQTSKVGRLFRRLLLGDTIRDTGCSLRVMKREVALRLPLEFKGMHRFIPATARHMNYKVVEMPVHHRVRTSGKTKYGSMGITARAIPGLIDCLAVRYMRSRRRPVRCEEPPSLTDATNPKRERGNTEATAPRLSVDVQASFKPTESAS
ncbi:MAG: glycosyltransferase [Leptolyngbya sp. PLA3]|nr:MAG: glycosyltransferase [Cyanobacteria bacterium CYA]MCE7968488.1 glycosyltransferase [Leptolyngbya sp. PL-A3]